MVEEANSHGRS